MPWNPNIPRATDILSVSQGDLQGNFQAIATVLNPTLGIQTHIFPNVAAPAAVPQLQISAQTGLNGLTQLFLTRQSLSTDNPTNFAFTEAVKTTAGWARLPSGILIKWGFVVGANGNPFTVVFPVAGNIPAFTAIFNVQVTTANASVEQNRFVQLRNPDPAGGELTTLSFNVCTTQRTANVQAASSFSWFAIGI